MTSRPCPRVASRRTLLERLALTVPGLLNAPGLAVRISDEFLWKHRFDEKKTDQMERENLDTAR